MKTIYRKLQTLLAVNLPIWKDNSNHILSFSFAGKVPGFWNPLFILPLLLFVGCATTSHNSNLEKSNEVNSEADSLKTHAGSLYDAGRFDEAIPVMKKVLETNPKDTVIYYGLMASYSALELFNESNHWMQQAHEIDPEGPWPGYWQCMISYNNILEGNRKSVIHYTDSLLTYASSNNPNAWSCAGSNEVYLGKFAEAKQHFERYIKEASREHAPLAHYGFVLKKTGELKKSEKLLRDYEAKRRQQIEEDASDHHAHQALAEIAAIRGNAEEAARHLKRMKGTDDLFWVYMGITDDADPFWDEIRDDPKIQSLMDQVKAKVDSMRTHVVDAMPPEKQVDVLMSEYDRDDVPGAVIGVVQDGRLIFAKGYGMADLTNGVPITTDTRFDIGSVSKQFTAFALALLEKQGKLSLDDPVQKYLPEIPHFKQEVTLRHLLTHTSGLHETYGMDALAGRIPGEDRLRPKGALEVVERQPELEFPPGSKFQYNSSAYVLLSMVVTRVTEQPFADWMQENVFGPLDMKHTVIERDVEQVIPGAADSYEKAEYGGYRTVYSNRVYQGAADIYTTVGDLAKWLENFHTAELGGPEIQEEMHRRFVFTSGDTSDYALGLFIDELRGLKRISHSGGHAAFVTMLSYYPELNTGVIVMRNDGQNTVADKVTDIFFGKYLEPEEQQVEPLSFGDGAKVDSLLLKSYAGTYRTPEDFPLPSLTWEYKNGKLFNVFPDERVPMIAVSDSVFQLAETANRISFHQTLDGGVPQATIISEDDKPVLNRIETWNPALRELKNYEGRYYSSELETFYTLQAIKGKLIARHRWNGDLELTPIEHDAFFGGYPLIYLRFERDEEGRVTGFLVSVGRTQNVRFKRQ